MVPTFASFLRLLPVPNLSRGACLALAGAALALTGCHQLVNDPNDPRYVVAEKDDWKITKGDLDSRVQEFMKERQLTADQVGAAKMPVIATAELRSMVLEKLLMAKGATMNLPDVDKDTAAAFDQFKAGAPSQADYQAKLKEIGLTEDDVKKKIHDQILMNAVLKSEALKEQEPSEQEINDFYLKAKDRYFTHPAKIRASRVLIIVDDHTSPADKVKKKKAIDAAHDRVAHGEDFSKVAAEVSEDRYSAPKGGDIGSFQPGENEPEFDQVAFNAKVGELSPVFQTPLGYQFLKVTESVPAGVVSEAEARSTISEFLKHRQEQGQIEKYTMDLLKNSGVIYHYTFVELPDSTNAPAATPPAADATPASANDAAPATNAGTAKVPGY